MGRRHIEVSERTQIEIDGIQEKPTRLRNGEKHRIRFVSESGIEDPRIKRDRMCRYPQREEAGGHKACHSGLETGLTFHGTLLW